MKNFKSLGEYTTTCVYSSIGQSVAYRPIINPVGIHVASRGHASGARRQFTMQLPEIHGPPPLAPLWDRILRARALPPDLDVQLLYIAIKDRLTHPEWEVRLHALRVLADLLPLSGNALSFPFDQVIDNLGHTSPNVRKAALDALRVFCSHCEEPECGARAILDKCFYNNIRPHSADLSFKINVVTGLVLSIPTLFGILKRRHRDLDIFPVIENLGDKLFDSMHKDAALRSLMKLRRVCGPRDYALCFSRLDPRVQDKFRYLCEMYDEDSMDVYYGPRRSRNQNVLHINRILNNPATIPIHFSTDSSSDDSYKVPMHNNNYAKVIIETEIKFDSDTAITMTVLEQNETESEKNTASDDECSSDDRLFLKYSEEESEEDADVIVKKVRFGGESVKIRTPDSDNLLNSEDDSNQNNSQSLLEKLNEEVSLPDRPSILDKANEIKREAVERENLAPPKKSGIPLPVIQKQRKSLAYVSRNDNRIKSKSLSELYDYFNGKKKKTIETKSKERTDFALTLSEVKSPEKVSSPVESHREVEVLHNLQRSPTVSPRRPQTHVTVDTDRFILDLIASSPPESLLISPRPTSPLQLHYDWEALGVVPEHIVEQLHNTENWISAVKAADQLHGALLESDNVALLETAALSLVQHMWALSDAIPATRAPAEGVVCSMVRNANADCIRQLLPDLLRRLSREPAPTALPHALLLRISLHHLVELVFDQNIITETDLNKLEAARLQATMCLAKAAGPAAVLAAVRRCSAALPDASMFCYKLRDKINKPLENIQIHVSRTSQLPIPTRRRRAMSTPTPAPRPRRLKPLPDSAPSLGISSPGRSLEVRPIPRKQDTSANTNLPEEIITPVKEKDKTDDSSTFEKIENEPEITSQAPSTPSIHVEDFSEKTQSSGSLNASNISEQKENVLHQSDEAISQKSESISNKSESMDQIDCRPKSEKSILERRKSGFSTSSIRSISLEQVPQRHERDIRTALAETIIPARHEDWEAIVSALTEIERLARDETARAPAASWRSVVRTASTHVRSLRSRVARAACSALGSLFESRGKILESDVEEAAGALLERCADANRFLRAEAANALGQVACGAGCARAGVALARKGATHRAGPVRAAAAQALTRLTRHTGPSKILDLPPEPRIVILRAAGELLGDAHPETRLHARHLCILLSEDPRFHQMLKDSMPLSRYRAIEKYVEKLRCR
ncbi:unnamed protein product [Pieris brassicae]|uniref:TOG domain-containing protein n=1 Tax=Pieris brassicae TaxID=7116 RepID=A0A9P0TTT7_PIEBR|nr:unnamed protein product [Pieris brassicae]